MSDSEQVGVVPFRMKDGRLTAGEAVVCPNEDAAARRGHRMLERCQGLVFFKVTTSADGDVWSEILATVGEAPVEAA